MDKLHGKTSGRRRMRKAEQGRKENMRGKCGVIVKVMGSRNPEQEQAGANLCSKQKRDLSQVHDYNTVTHVISLIPMFHMLLT